jgi:hypothetical protein
MNNGKLTRVTGLVVWITAAWLTAPVFAQADLEGGWIAKLHQDWQDRNPGPDLADYSGLPINAEARAKALAYSASILSQPQRQCLYYTEVYLATGGGGMKMWSESDSVTGKVVAWKVSAALDRAFLTVWMDGRPHPPKYAPHPLGGFTTGVWEGRVLTTYTSHMKAGYLRRNGVPTSDQAILIMHFIQHGDLLTIHSHIEDPLYLTEPDVDTTIYQRDPTGRQRRTPNPCTPAVEVAAEGIEGAVPHYLPGKNPFVDEDPSKRHIPPDALMGGAETTYPEYRKKLKDIYVVPEKCIRYCCGGGNIEGLGCPAR